MSKIAIIGHGNLGYHFDKKLIQNHRISVFTRHPVNDHTNALESFNADGYDFVILAVSDDAIKSVSDSFDTSRSIVIHTSGSRPMSDLAHHTLRSVIYPLQTFSKSKEIDFNSLQLYVESTPEVSESVLDLARDISPNIKRMNSEGRAKIHLAAVFACNFSNHMYHIAENLLKEVNLDFQDIRSLVEETLEKAIEMTPSKSQTGPAIRSDVSTLALHENLIEDEQIKELYQLITKNIQRFY